MLKNLFSRKKNKEPVKPVKAVAPVPEQKSLDQWADEISQASGKARNQLLGRVSEAIEKNEFTLQDALAKLDTLPAAMLKIQLDQDTSSITADTWQQLVIEGHTAKVRNTAAERIDNEDVLAALVKSTKGKDKTVYRILHDKLETLNAERKEKQDWQAKKDAVLEAMTKLANAPIEPMYEAKLKGFVEQWKELAVSDEQAEQQFSQAQDKAQAKIDALVEEAAHQQKQAETIKMANSNRQQLITALVEKIIGRLNDLDFSDSMIAEDQQFLTDIQHQWREIEHHSKASKEEYRQFQKACTAFELGLPQFSKLLEKYSGIIAMVTQLNDSTADNEQLLHDVDDWLHDMAFVLDQQTPESINHLKQALDQYQQSLAEHRKQEVERVRSIRGQIRRCMSAVEEGSLRRASGLYHGVEEKLEGFDLTHHAGIKKQLDEVTEALEKLRDWQSFAVLPKKEALIKRMSALVNNSTDPETRAQAIRDMQDEWKLLSRGLQDRQQELWETFHDLAQKAYEPCREYFSEQRNLREINLDRRKEVVLQLTKYSEIINWDAPDVKEIDRILQVARNDWRHYSPVDRVANKPIQAQFDRLHKSLLDKLQKEQDVFKENKRHIIEQAKALLELEDVKEATEQAKKLQRDWKAAGVVARKDEQTLWASFREICDQLFERREQQVNAFKADLDANKEQAERIIAGLVALTQSDTLLAQQSEFESLKAEYEALGTLPKSHYPRLTKQFKEVCGKFDLAKKAAQLQAADSNWVALIEWVAQARSAQASSDELTAQWQAMKVPEPARGLIDALPKWQAPVDELNQAALHEKTIELEILTGAPSPESDARIRMNLQVQALSEGIGASVTDADVDQMVVEWLSIGAVEPSFYRELETRMISARQYWKK